MLENVLVRPSTKNQYKIYWRKFENFCRREGRVVFPLDVKVVADFMVSLASTTRSKASASMAKATIRYFHGLHFPGQEDPTDNRIVREVLKYVRKTFSKEIR